MKSVFLPAFLVALGSVSFAFGDVNAPTDLSENLKKARESLAKMGLSIQRAGSRIIGGKSGVAVHRAAIIEEEGKSYVVVLDGNDPSNSEKIQVRLGDRSGDYVHAKNGVTPGDYLVVRAEDLTPSKTPAPSPPSLAPVEIREPEIAKRISSPEVAKRVPSPPQVVKREPAPQVAERVFSPPQVAKREPTPSSIFRRGVPIQIPNPSPLIPNSTLNMDRYDLSGPTSKSDPKICAICNVPHSSENSRSPLFQSDHYESFTKPDLRHDNGFDYPQWDSPRQRNHERPFFFETPGFDPFFLNRDERYYPEYHPFDSGCSFEPSIYREPCSWWGH